MRTPVRAVALALAAACLSASPSLSAQPPPVVEAQARAVVLAPTKADPSLVAAARTVDAAFADAALDLGIAVEPGKPGTANLAIASATVRAERDGVSLHIDLVQPGGAVVARTEHVPLDDLAARAAVLFRDVVREGNLAVRAEVPSPPPIAAFTVGPPPPAPPSVGKPALAVTSTAFGAFYGLSIQQSSGSTDPRLLFPLLAVGAGVGLGASLLVAEEWNITNADAFYLAAGMIWPSAAGQLLYAGKFPLGVNSERWTFGLVGGTAGLLIAGGGLAIGPMTDAGALTAHSGGALGFGFGAMAELFARGTTRDVPLSGMGYGTALGWLAASAVATRLRVPGGRVLGFDAGAVLGGLGGAAVASPLLSENPDEGRTRAWLGIVAGSTLAGAAAGVYFTRDRPEARKAAEYGLPSVGVLGESALGARRAPILGLGWAGEM